MVLDIFEDSEKLCNFDPKDLVLSSVGEHFSIQNEILFPISVIVILNELSM